MNKSRLPRHAQAIEARCGGDDRPHRDDLPPAAWCRVFWSRCRSGIDHGTANRCVLVKAIVSADVLEGAAHFLAIVEDIFGVSFPEATGVQASRLSRVFDVAGTSLGEGAAFHYVVETDPETGWAEEIARWYDTEHMPGLASVPGCVRASRFLNHDHSPLSLACYDLLTQETLGSDPWLAVRNTDWSSRARPHFTNTLRTMFVPAGARPRI